MISLLVGGMLVFSRLAGLFMTLPGLGGSGVPMLARMALALPLTVVLLPAYAPTDIPGTVPALLGGVAGEAVVGAGTGIVVSLVFGSLVMAFDIIGGQMGLQAAAMMDPISGIANGAMGSLATWLATGVFFGSNLHLRCVLALGHSFEVLPAGTARHLWRAGGIVFEAGTAALVTGVQLAGPLVLFVSMVNLGLALLGRMAPNLNLFFGIGHTLTLLAGFALVAIALPAILVAWAAFLEQQGFAPLVDLWRLLA